MEMIALGIYLVGYVGFIRLFIYYVAKEWPTLGWRSIDTVAAFYFGLAWPIITLLILLRLYRLKYPATPKKSLFARIYAKDRTRP